MRYGQRHKRSRWIGMTVAAVAAMAVGGGALLMTDNNAEAARGSARPQWAAAAAMTINCPDVAVRLSQVPQQARPTVDNELAQLDSQVADAYGQLAAAGGKADQKWVRTRVLDPLSSQRRLTLDRIAAEIDRVSNRPEQLDSLASCTVKRDEVAPASASASPSVAAAANPLLRVPPLRPSAARRRPVPKGRTSWTFARYDPMPPIPVCSRTPPAVRSSRAAGATRTSTSTPTTSSSLRV